jgi:hypothetical protein
VSGGYQRLLRAATPPLTARRRTAEAAAEQARVIAALAATGDMQVAGRLRRCMEAMTSRRNGGGYPWTCRGVGCAWCRQSLGRRWWRGMRFWITEGGAPVTLAILPLPHRPGGLRAAVAHLRRACRDVRDRAARRRARWKGIAMAGMATGDAAHVLVRHPRVDPLEVAEVLAARWPESIVGDVDAAEPSWALAVEDAAALARVGRGVEPLRVLILPQGAAAADALHRTVALEAPGWIEPMPVAL